LYKKNGKNALELKTRGRKVGTGRLLCEKQENYIQLMITQFLPEHCNLDYSTWTRKAVVELVFSEFKIKIAVRTMGDYLKRWGFTPQKPSKRAYQRDEKKVEEWLNTTYPQIVVDCNSSDGGRWNHPFCR
jgi:transposase